MLGPLNNSTAPSCSHMQASRNGLNYWIPAHAGTAATRHDLTDLGALRSHHRRIGVANEVREVDNKVRQNCRAQ